MHHLPLHNDSEFNGVAHLERCRMAQNSGQRTFLQANNYSIYPINTSQSTIDHLLLTPEQFPRNPTNSHSDHRNVNGVIDLTQDDEDTIISIDIHPKSRNKRRKQSKNGKNQRIIRFDKAHIQSTECTEICFDIQQAMEIYRSSTPCAICLDTLQHMTSTRCGHVFCSECIIHAIQSTRKCPMCQAPTNLTDIHLLHL